MRAEAAKWGGRLLLHQEFAAERNLSKRGSLAGAAGSGGGAASGSGAKPAAQKGLLPLLGGSFLTPPNNPVTPQVAGLHAAFASPSFAHRAGSRAYGDAAAAAEAAAAGAFGPGFAAAPGGISSAAVAAAVAQMAAASVDAGAGAGTPAGAKLPAPGSALAADGGAPPPPFSGFGATPPSAPPPAPPAPAAGAGRPPLGPSGAAAAAAAAAGGGGGGATPPPPVPAAGRALSSGGASARLHDDVTALVDAKPGAAVIPFWEPLELGPGSPPKPGAPPPAAAPAPAGPPSRRVLATCRDVADQLAEEGFRVSYRRIPLSRDRTPVAGDLGDLHAQLELRPGGGGGGGGAPPPRVLHLVLSRTATGSSARFAAAALATYLLAQGPGGALPEHGGGGGAGGGPAGGSPARGSPAKGGGAAAAGGPPAKKLRRSLSDLGEYRGIVSVTRLLPKGTDVKGAVDEAIQRCVFCDRARAGAGAVRRFSSPPPPAPLRAPRRAPRADAPARPGPPRAHARTRRCAQIGNMREDIKACRRIASAAPSSATDDPQTSAWAARQLGVHYLKRYFLLICYRAFIDQTAGGAPPPPPPRRATGEGGAPPARAASGGGNGAGGAGGGGGGSAFARWMEERRELGHLLGHLTLEA